MTLNPTLPAGNRPPQPVETEDQREERRHILRIVCLFAIAVAILGIARWYEQQPPAPNFSGYYSGPWVNKQGQLVAPDGTILQERYSPAQKPGVSPM